jgi:hypothetical protein
MKNKVYGMILFLQGNQDPEKQENQSVCLTALHLAPDVFPSNCFLGTWPDTLKLLSSSCLPYYILLSDSSPLVLEWNWWSTELSFSFHPYSLFYFIYQMEDCPALMGFFNSDSIR